MNSVNNPQNTRVIVGMSGGVDSSVTALICQNQGYEVEGLFMKNWEEDDETEYCTAVEDLADARAVCDKLGIKLNEANFAAEYWENVFAHFLEEYAAGRTPNPDVLCNREIKFQVFAEYARILGADLIATGHYARLTRDSDNLHLRKAVDTGKDQSYFLQSVSATQFANVIFPLGEIPKTEVREIARAHDLATHAKKDSTGICFIGERRFKDFLKTYLPARPGQILDVEGNHLGEHEGLMYHTLGQRQGLGIGGVSGKSEAPWYVVAKEVATNQLIVAQGNNHPSLFCRNMTISHIAWVNEPPPLPASLQVKTRYRQADQVCHIKQTTSGFEINFDEPQRAVTPGQWACFYQDDICLGGGIIKGTDASYAA